MDFRFTPEQEEFRQQVKVFLDERWPKETRDSLPLDPRDPKVVTQEEREIVLEMGRRGWLAVAWPKEYGGQGKGMAYQYLLWEEMEKAGVWFPATALTMVGPTIFRVGTDDQKREWLPHIVHGEMELSLGYTEPNAGSDLASLQTRAVEDGDDYVINGQKMFHTEGHIASHAWLLARTDPSAPKHRGLSVFIVPLDSAGVTVRPLWTLGGGRTNELFLENVRVPKKNLIGEPNRGWYHVAMALDFERVGANRYIACVRVLTGLLQFVRTAKADGRPLAKDPVVRQIVGELATEVEVARLFAYRSTWMIEKGLVPNYEASAEKAWATELEQRIANAGTQIMGIYGQLAEGEPKAPLEGKMEGAYRTSVVRTIGGGTSQIQRDVIARRGLGLPRG
ncbi:MAG: acyl-CoA dehydrogenase family protein [Chloroflexi bacterium]|nr:acyl-CoA dehydrogenase family protein [Chloroflexota bacterium]